MPIKDTGFLPVTKDEMKNRGWDEVDVVLITGDAYVDHPAFGTAVIGRMLEHKGYRVGVIAMPDWRDPSSIGIFGKPGLFFGVTSGAIDSMLSRYTAFKRYRSDDPYLPGGKNIPGGKAGSRPERAVIAYCNLIKKIFKDVPIVIGGIEASMRRIAHYDFWDNKVRRSIIEDSRADILVYGMGEMQIAEIAGRLSAKKELAGIPGTVIMSKHLPENTAANVAMLPAEENALNSKKSLLDLYNKFYSNQHRILSQPAGKRFLIHYPGPEINPDNLDIVYQLPYMRRPHPSYKEPVPAFEMIKNSITSHRGCVSGCSFCSLSLHQGKKIVSRSRDSILEEAETIAGDSSFNGHISDIGGPSANMYGFSCSISRRCGRESCTYPSLCPNLVFNTKNWINILDSVSAIRRVKSVTLGSGIRYDVFMTDPDHKAALKAIIKSHISGQLKIAPENTSPRVLRAMSKNPVFELKEFINLYKQYNAKTGKKQYLIPYLMSCHPGCLYKDMEDTRMEILSLFGFVPDQVQAFIPLPMTLSSIIYYTGIDPLTHERFPVVRDMNDRRKQHKVFTV